MLSFRVLGVVRTLLQNHCRLCCSCLRELSFCEHDVIALSWLNAETLKRVPVLPLWQTCKVFRPWVLFRETMVVAKSMRGDSWVCWFAIQQESLEYEEAISCLYLYWEWSFIGYLVYCPALNIVLTVLQVTLIPGGSGWWYCQCWSHELRWSAQQEGEEQETGNSTRSVSHCSQLLLKE